ncbi:MAG TPA: amino acid adenylation domain-containing protein, partial [Candidatus Deferrimicrobium sp.]|nr:amino acid adenylation domain-containing protein [Candidatus Deferrimicrobium sp.]
YLPIDPEFPQERIDYMLKDSGAKLLAVANGQDSEKLGKWEGEKILLEDIFKSPKRYSYFLAHLPSYHLNSSNIAYIIYTSGSTGRPKGVLVEHRSVVNLICHQDKYFNINRSDRILQFSSICFDASVEQMFIAFSSGAILILPDKNTLLDFNKFDKFIIRHRVSHIHAVPSFINNIQLINSSQLKRVISGGDVCPESLAKKWNISFNFYNEYGPTETTVTSIEILIKNANAFLFRIPIGKPINNTVVYILDQWLNPAPLGVIGELYIGGSGVARGYLNCPELTAEKFGKQITQITQMTIMKNYKTGDLARWISGGNIEFMGRIDHQVKIRGYRIELGEIENRLLQKQEITAAVVVVKENKKTEKYLCAYIVSHEEIPPTQLTDHLAAALPTYMIPAYFVRLEKLPLTVQGKIDHKTLEMMPDSESIVGGEYSPPDSDIEHLLVKIWEQVMGHMPIGVNDNFFTSGGDSIKAIQISARMNRKGYKIGVRDIFQNPTIARLAPFIKKIEHIIVQTPVSGAVPLTPIQVEFFQNHKSEPHHYNQAFMFYSKENLDEPIIKAIFFKLQEHHDALRMVYNYEKQEEVSQENLDIGLNPDIWVYDLRKRKDAAAVLMKEANKIQAGINLKTGPLMKIGLFHLDDGERLLIVIHHLVVDGISWRILFEDIDILYRQCKKREPMILPPRTDSFKTWAERLIQYAGTPLFLKEKTYWTTLESQIITSIPKDFAQENNSKKDEEKLSFNLGENETNLLLTRAHEAFGTEINDLLLTALGMAIKQMFGVEKIAVALEGHGREEIFADVDIKRTVGWFTIVYPIILDFSHRFPGQDLGRQIKEIKEHLHHVPNKGIGYGIIKYLSVSGHKKDIHFTLKPQIIFNYLGQFDSNTREMSFRIAAESPGHMTSSFTPREFELDVESIIAEKRLFMTIFYSKKQYRKETIQNLMNHYRETLTHIITYCCSRERSELTPSDFSYSSLTIEQVELLEHKYSPYLIEDIYTLSPLQEGMLFQWMYEQNSLAYFLQTSYQLRGEFDITLLRESFNQLLQRHQALRALFVHQGVERPIQVILKDKEIDFHYEDIHHLSGMIEKEQWLEDYREKDRQRSFDLTQAAPMRVSVIQLERNQFEIIWSHHHILMDGWCRGILIAEYLEIFASLLEKRTPRLPHVTPYREYIRWLDKQSPEQGRQYWSRYLQGNEETACIPKRCTLKEDIREYRVEAVAWKSGKEKEAGLMQLAARNQVTVSTVMHTLWGILLSKYNDKQDVIFGSVVSGRPSEIQGVEAMIGLFINTVPFRLRFHCGDRFAALLKQMQKQTLESEAYHYLPLTEIQAQSLLKQNLFDHILVFENYPTALRIEGITDKIKQDQRFLKLNLMGVKIFEQTHYNFIVVISNEPLTIKIQYNTEFYDSESVNKILGHLNSIIDQVLADEQIEIQNIAVQYELLEADVTAGEDEYENFGF